MRKGLPDVPDQYKRRGVFIAKWGGKPCGVCDEPIEVGDECMYIDDVVSHAECDD